jgi:hypothetical protein
MKHILIMFLLNSQGLAGVSPEYNSLSDCMAAAQIIVNQTGSKVRKRHPLHSEIPLNGRAGVLWACTQKGKE